MNKVILIGRLTRNPAVRYTQGERPTAVARYTLAVNRTMKREGEPDADFINCVAFGRAGEFAEKYLSQGVRILISGRIRTGSYTNRDGVKVYTNDVIIESQEFTESKASSEWYEMSGNTRQAPAQDTPDGFMNIPDGLDEELPFS